MSVPRATYKVGEQLPCDVDHVFEVCESDKRKCSECSFANNCQCGVHWAYCEGPLYLKKIKIDADGKPVKEVSRKKYNVECKGITLDVYDVLKAFNVTCPALQHLIKKALKAGERGHKDLTTDLDDIIFSAKRAKDLVS